MKRFAWSKAICCNCDCNLTEEVSLNSNAAIGYWAILTDIQQTPSRDRVISLSIHAALVKHDKIKGTSAVELRQGRCQPEVETPMGAACTYMIHDEFSSDRGRRSRGTASTTELKAAD